MTGASVAAALIRARTAAPIHASVSTSTLLVRALAALVVGLVFGTHPAMRAARLSPMDATVASERRDQSTLTRPPPASPLLASRFFVSRLPFAGCRS